MDEKSERASSRNIPLPIQRVVRQRCGFGCVICGFPLYEYEHMEGWANVHRHVAEEITLLCDQHHREKTVGLLPVDAVRKANDKPYNLRAGVSKPYLFSFYGSSVEALIGGCEFSTRDNGYGTIMMPIGVDGIPLLAFVLADGHLLLNMVLFDEYNSPILHIKNNQMVYKSGVWDITFIGRTLVFREEHRKILIEIEFITPNKINIKRGRFLCNGIEIIVRPNNLMITNNAIIFSGMKAINCPGGLILGHWDQPLGGAVRVEGIPRYNWDRTAALEYERESMKRSEELNLK